jgi:hypothetical protein
MPARLFARAVPLFVLYAALVSWLAWPLPAQLGTHVPYTNRACRFDMLYTIWALAWQTHALGTAPLALFDANIYHPTASALLYGPAPFGALPLFAPIFALTGNPALAINLTFLLALALTALGLHLVVRQWVGSEAAGLVAATVFLTNAWLWTWVPTAPHYAVLVLLPWIVLVASDALTARGAGVLLALVVLQALVEPVYIAPAVLAPLGVLALWRLARRRGDGLRLLGVVCAAAAVLVPLYLAYGRVYAANPTLADQTLWKRSLLFPLFFPLRLDAKGLWGNGTTDASWLLIVLVLAGAACMAIVGPRTPAERRGWLHAGLWAGVGLLISTRVFVPFGWRTIRLPHYEVLATWFPGALGVARLPARFGVVGLIAIAMLAGLATAALARAAARLFPLLRTQRVLRAALAAALVVALHVGHRATARHFDVMPAAPSESPVVTALQRSDTPVLELPVTPIGPNPHARERGVLNGVIAGQHAAAMYRSIFHWRPLLNGYSSYWPAGFPERVELAARLPDAAALRTLCEQTGLGAVLVRTAELGAAERARWLALWRDGGRADLRPLASDGDDLLFEVGPPGPLG